METKICTKCNQQKNIVDFRKYYDKKSNKIIYRAECKECESKYRKKKRCENIELAREKARNLYNIKYRTKQKEYREKNKEKIKKYREEYNKKNKEKISEARHQRYEKNKEKEKQYYYENIERIKQVKKIYYENNKEERHIYNTNYYKNNRDKILKQVKEYYIKNKQQKFAYNRKYEKYKMENDNTFLLKRYIRKIIRDSLKRKFTYKNCKIEEILGCSVNSAKDYLLQTYKNNYGEELKEYKNVHIDHIIPLATANTEEEVLKLCHYTNLQLLKAKDNLSKGKKINWKLENNND